PRCDGFHRRSRRDAERQVGSIGRRRDRDRIRRRAGRARRHRRRRQARAGGSRHGPHGEVRGSKGGAVNLSRPLIEPPGGTSLLVAALLLAGGLAYKMLPVSALPQVDYPTIEVLTFYPGASPDVMASSVTAPLERQFGQLPGLNQMTSTSSQGSSV